jgi:regulatory protein
VRVIFLDEEDWHTTAAPVIRELGLAEGDIVDTDDLARSIEAAERVAARERALATLGYRERSVAELRTKVLDDGYPTGIVDDVVASLESAGIVDDARFTEMLVRSMAVGKRLGRHRIERELELKGIAPEVAALALNEYLNLDDAPGRVLDAARRLARGGDRVDLLAARLVRKGYAPGEAFGAARETLAAMQADEGESDGA